MDAECNGGGGGGSEGEDGYISRPPLNANGISSRKRVKLHGKTSEVHGPVDPALVPRRLRSAMNKRISQPASLPLSDSKRRQHHASNRTQFFNSSSAERFKQNMLDEVTKDEEEAAETLTSMASFITISKPVKTKEDRKMLEENAETKASSASPLEGSREEGTKFLVPCNCTTASNPSPCVEDSPETIMADPSTLGQPTAASVSQKSDAEAIGISQDSMRKLPSNMEPIEGVIPLRDATNLSNPLGASRQYYHENGMLQPIQLDSLLVQKQEMKLWPLGPASIEHDLQSLKQKHQGATHDVRRKDPHVQPGLDRRGHERLTMPSLSKAAAYPNSDTVLGRPGSINGLPTDKLSLTSADNKRQWCGCTTHINISRLIQNHQKAEKKQQSMLQANQSKAKEVAHHTVPTSGETGGSRNGMIPPLSSGSLLERSMLEARNRMLQDGRLLQAQQAAVLSGAYAPQKQACDLLSLSTVGDTKSSRNGMNSPGQLHVPYPPNQAVMPFAFPQGSYISHNQEQLAAGTAQQVQLPLPTYIANGQLYGPNRGQAGGAATTQQQQQQHLMWQAHFAHYRLPVGTGFLPKWQQNGRQHDSSSSSPLIISQPPHSVFPLPADFNPHNLHQPFILPIPSSSSSSRSKQKQQHSGGGLNLQSSSQLQMVCNAESFR